MKSYARKLAVSLFAGAALTVGALAPAMAAPVVTGGLVNVTVVDLVDANNNQVLNGVSVVVAAALCNTTVQALVVNLGPTGQVADCNASPTTTTTVTQRSR